MDSMVTTMQNYFTNTFNTLKTVNNVYNPAVRQKFTTELLYRIGYLRDNELVNIIGKPNNYVVFINEEFDTFLQNVKDESDDFLTYINNLNRFNNKLTRVLKNNYITFIKNLKLNFTTELTTYTQSLSANQLELIKNLTKLNILCTSNGYDGFKDKSGNIITYKLTSQTIDGSDSETKVLENKDIIKNDLQQYYDLFLDNGVIKQDKTIVFEPVSGNEFFNSNINKRNYLILSQYILDDKMYLTFKNSLLGTILENINDFGVNANELEDYFDRYWVGKIKPIFKSETDSSNNFLDSFQQNNLTKFYNYKPYRTNERIEYTYVKDENDIVSRMVENLGAVNNSENSKDSWNKIIDGAYLAKVKFL